MSSTFSNQTAPGPQVESRIRQGIMELHRTAIAKYAFVVFSAAAALVLSSCIWRDSTPVMSIAAPTLPSFPTATMTPVPPTATATVHRTSTPVPTFTLVPTAEPWSVLERRYYFPVQPSKLAVYSKEHHDYPAADIFVPADSVVVAVTSGIVDEVSRIDRWNPRTNEGAFRGGLWVSIIGNDGVRYYTSHLSSVEPGIEAGARVHAGQIVGRSGHTGNATPTPPHVHFGISHPTLPGDWVIRRGEIWPYEYLQAWAHGRDLTPVLPQPRLGHPQPRVRCNRMSYGLLSVATGRGDDDQHASWVPRGQPFCIVWVETNHPCDEGRTPRNFKPF